MPNFNNQQIVVTLIRNQEIHIRLDQSSTIPTDLVTVKPDYFVPHHIHDHGQLTGLFDDDHPQYLTDARAADLFQQLIIQIGGIEGAANLGTGTGIFSTKNGVYLEFKSLIEGNNITISEVDGEITIDHSGTATTIDDGTY